MATSTLFGTAPPTDDDLRLVKGLIRLLKKHSVWTARTNQGLSLSVHPPPNFKFESRGLELVISAAIFHRIKLFPLLAAAFLCDENSMSCAGALMIGRSYPLRSVTPVVGFITA